MPQYITIKNFGPITSIEKMEVKDFMLFIGERATGKSTIAKLIYFFKSLKNDYLEYYFEYLRTNKYESETKFDNKIRYKLSQFFGPTFDLSKTVELTFQYTDDPQNIISFISIDGALDVNYGQSINQIDELIIKKCDGFLKANGIITYTSAFQDNVIHDFQKSIAEDINKIFDDQSKLIFIPSQRGVFTVFPSFSSFDKVSIDFLLTEFSREIGKIRIAPNNSLSTGASFDRALLAHIGKESIKILREKGQTILKGSYKSNSDALEQIILNDGTAIPIHYASSGQQESLWILNTLQYLAVYSASNFIVIEEPEVHLDPQAQDAMIEAIVCFGVMHSNQVIVTTHSPFILNTLSNILYASKLSKEHKEEVEKLGFTPEILLDPDKVAIYKCINGGVESIMEDGRVNNEEIDNISGETLHLLDSLIDIELKYENEV